MQTNEAMEFSRYGVRLSYARYLSDSAPGFLLIIAIVSFYYLLKLQWLFESFTPDTEIKVGIFILVFLLATPLGLSINAISWWLLGWFQECITKCYMKKIIKESCQTDPTLTEKGFVFIRALYWPEWKYTSTENATSVKTVSIPPDPNKLFLIYSYTKYYERLLFVYFPNFYIQTGYLTGLSNLLRSIAFMTSIIVIILLLLLCLFPGCESKSDILFCQLKNLGLMFGTIVILLLIFLGSIRAAGFLDFYSSISTLSYVHALVVENRNWDTNEKDINKRGNEIAECLIALGKNLMNRTRF